MANILNWDDADLKEALDKLITETPERLSECMNNACLAIEADAKMLCPKDSGELRRSIQSEVKIEGEKIEGIVGATADYAVYVHEGTGIHSRTGAGRSDVPWVYYSDKLGHCVKTSGIESTPFLEDAVNKNRASIADYFMGVFK